QEESNVQSGFPSLNQVEKSSAVLTVANYFTFTITYRNTHPKPSINTHITTKCIILTCVSFPNLSLRMDWHTQIGWFRVILADEGGEIDHLNLWKKIGVTCSLCQSCVYNTVVYIFSQNCFPPKEKWQKQNLCVMWYMPLSLVIFEPFPLLGGLFSGALEMHFLSPAFLLVNPKIFIFEALFLTGMWASNVSPFIITKATEKWVTDKNPTRNPSGWCLGFQMHSPSCQKGLSISTDIKIKFKPKKIREPKLITTKCQFKTPSILIFPFQKLFTVLIIFRGWEQCLILHLYFHKMLGACQSQEYCWTVVLAGRRVVSMLIKSLILHGFYLIQVGIGLSMNIIVKTLPDFHVGFLATLHFMSNFSESTVSIGLNLKYLWTGYVFSLWKMNRRAAFEYSFFLSLESSSSLLKLGFLVFCSLFAVPRWFERLWVTEFQPLMPKLPIYVQVSLDASLYQMNVRCLRIIWVRSCGVSWFMGAQSSSGAHLNPRNQTPSLCVEAGDNPPVGKPLASPRGGYRIITGNTWQSHGNAWQSHGNAWQSHGNAWQSHGNAWQNHGNWQSHGNAWKSHGNDGNWQSHGKASQSCLEKPCQFLGRPWDCLENPFQLLAKPHWERTLPVQCRASESKVSALCMKLWTLKGRNYSLPPYFVDDSTQSGQVHTPEDTKDYTGSMVLGRGDPTDGMLGIGDIIINGEKNKGRLKWGCVHYSNSRRRIFTKVLNVILWVNMLRVYILEVPSRGQSSFGVLQFILRPHDIIMNWDKLPFTCKSVGIPFILFFFSHKVEICTNLECTCISYSTPLYFIIFNKDDMNYFAVLGILWSISKADKKFLLEGNLPVKLLKAATPFNFHTLLCSHSFEFPPTALLSQVLPMNCRTLHQATTFNFQALNFCPRQFIRISKHYMAVPGNSLELPSTAWQCQAIP
ncbi:uncharacterized protein VP01_119g4, partial [Puccinia sorghi]